MSAAKAPAHFVLGSVQLGAQYGKLRKFSFPSHDEAVALMRRAAALGVREFDTARNYGEAELRLGDAFDPAHNPLPPGSRIVTKLHPLQHMAADASETMARAAVEESIGASCRALRTKHLPIVMLHLVYLRHAWNGAAWRRLLEFRDAGIIGEIGISAVTPQEAIAFLDDPDIKHMQVPINILDRRWTVLSAAERFARRSDVTVHARSIFLQGVLLQKEPSGWPPRCAAAPALIDWLATLTREFGLGGVAQLAVSYLRGLGWLDGLVSGVENEHQLVENLRLFEEPPLDARQMAHIEATRPAFDDWLLDPGKW
ncbi:aldo/keto reductase [Dongia sp.]|uniref:aldo/keto reductase n=1 Tax=Dongia sp. TaxID=1977262 RepID=UPI0035AE37A9